MTSSSAFQVRLARGSDLPKLAPIEERAARRFIDSPHPAMATFPLFDSHELAALADDGGVWVAVDESDEPIGFAIVGRVGAEGYLHEIDVEPAWSGRGVGRALLERVFHLARSRGHATLVLSTFVDVPWNAPFYARVGFAAVPLVAYDAPLLELSERERAAGLPMASRVIMRASLTAVDA